MTADNPLSIGTTSELAEQAAEFTDNLFSVVDNNDATKALKFECASIATATTRTLTIPDRNGIVALVAANLTAGSVPFADSLGKLDQDNSGLHWDNTNKRLGVNTAAPEVSLHVTTTDQQPLEIKSSNSVRAQFNCGSTNTSATVTAEFVFVMTTTASVERGAARIVAGKTSQWDGTAGSEKGYMYFQTRDGTALRNAIIIHHDQNVGINKLVPAERLDVAGNVAIRTNDRLLLEGAGSDTYLHYDGTNVELVKNGTVVATW